MAKSKIIKKKSKAAGVKVVEVKPSRPADASDFAGKPQMQKVDNKTTIIAYVRKGSKRIGVMVAHKAEDGSVVIATSKWKRSSDNYNPEFGREVAIQRAKKGHTKTLMAFSMIEHVAKFTDRAKRYFKTDTVTVIGAHPLPEDMEVIS